MGFVSKKTLDYLAALREALPTDDTTVLDVVDSIGGAKAKKASTAIAAETIEG